MKKLTGEQLGRLAIHVESTVREFPTGNDNRQGIKGWEHHLANGINGDELLPSYAEIQKQHSIILDELISYFSER